MIYQPNVLQMVQGATDTANQIDARRQSMQLRDFYAKNGPAMFPNSPELAQLAGIAPEQAFQLQGLRQQQEARTAEQMTAAAQRLVNGVMSFPENLRPQAYKQALKVAQNTGMKLDGVPQEYDPAFMAVMQGMYAMPQQERTEFMQLLQTLPPEERNQAIRVRMGLAPEAKNPEPEKPPTGYTWIDPSDPPKGVRRIPGLPPEADPSAPKLPPGHRWKPGLEGKEMEPIPGAPATNQGAEIIMPDGTIMRTGPKLTEQQSKDLVYVQRAEAAEANLKGIDESLASLGERLSEVLPYGTGNYFQSPEYQQANQASREFLSAVLRKDTGAAVTDQEMQIYGKIYLPMPGDGPEVIAQKRDARKRAVEDIKSGLGPAEILAKESSIRRGTATEAPAPATPAVKPDGNALTERAKALAVELSKMGLSGDALKAEIVKRLQAEGFGK